MVAATYTDLGACQRNLRVSRREGRGAPPGTSPTRGANFLVAQTFLSLSEAITRQGVFFLYAALAVASVALFAQWVPETKGRSLEQIQNDLVEYRAEATS